MRIVRSLLTTGLALAFVLPAHAQDVEYTTKSKVEFSGALGTVMNLMGGGDESTEKNYIKGARMRTDSDDASSIIDLETGRLIQVDHKAKTYMVMTFEQMMEMMDRAVADGQRQMEQSEASRPEGDADMKYTLSVDPTDEREKINGYQAQRIFMTMQTELTVRQEGEDAQASGNLVVLQDTWNAQDVPMMQALAEMQEKAPEMAARTAGSMGGMGSIFTAKPEMRAAMEEAAKEAGKMEGFPMRSVTYMVLLPSGVEFDREAVLEEKESSGGGIGGLLRGRLGRGGDQPKPDQASSGQTTFVKVTTETEDIKMKSLSADLFEPPAGYTEKPFPTIGS